MVFFCCILFVLKIQKYAYFQCPTVSNPSQRNEDVGLGSNSDQLGNACDPDIDGDGIDNELDDDQDELGYFNIASLSGDYFISDGFPDDVDGCPQDYNLFEYDYDSDGVPDYVYTYVYVNGSILSTDVMGCDNCYGIPNPDQNDTDGYVFFINI